MSALAVPFLLVPPEDCLGDSLLEIEAVASYFVKNEQK